MSKSDIAYLCVFDINGWEPVAYETIKNGAATFKKVGKNVVLMPFVFQNRLRPAGDPFYLDNHGKPVIIRLDSTRKQRVKLIRKYPFFAYTAHHTRKLKGGRFEGSNSLIFENATILHEINHYPLYWNEVKLRSAKFRYIRFVPPPGYMASLAEFSIFDKDGKLIQGEPIGVKGLEGHGFDKAFDNDMNSYYESSDYFGGWIGLDLGPNSKTEISEIKFCPRNDTNCIIEGNRYELFYWDKRWVSLGVQEAQSSSIDFENVPVGSLLWLHCLNGGKEERIFTYENEKQVWW